MNSLDIFFEVVNYTAGFLLVILWVPQIKKIYKKKTTNGLSKLMIGMNIIAITLLTTYSIYHKIYSIMIPGIAGTILRIVVIIQMIYYKATEDSRESEESADSKDSTNSGKSSRLSKKETASIELLEV